MRSYQHFTLEERQNLHDKLSEKKSMRAIAREMRRDVSSISREISRNKNKDGSYNAWRGCVLYIMRRRKSRKQYRLDKNPELSKWVTDCLAKYWPPETIVEKWKLEHQHEKLSHTTVYAAIKARRLQGYSAKTHLRRRGRRKKAHNTATIHPEHYIHDRPEATDARNRIGDWEGDTMHGGIGKGGIVTCVDRKSRYMRAALIHDFISDHTSEAMKKALGTLKVHTITVDNGSEFAGFKDIEETLQTTIYFADPHSPWQRGTNENMNDVLRFFYPKGTNFHAVAQEELDYVLSLINNRPRKCLGWLTPGEVFFRHCCT